MFVIVNGLELIIRIIGLVWDLMEVCMVMVC